MRRGNRYRQLGTVPSFMFRLWGPLHTGQVCERFMWKRVVGRLVTHCRNPYRRVDTLVPVFRWPSTRKPKRLRSVLVGGHPGALLPENGADL